MQFIPSNYVLKKYIAKLIVGIIVVGLTSCGTPSTEDRIETPTEPVPPTASPIPEQPQSTNTVQVTIYTADAECQELIPQTVEVPSDRQIEAAVGEVLEERTTVAFDLAGYRVQLNENTGVATVDLRLDPESERQFVSLSSCEKFSLFGSLEKTLTSNPEWQINRVRFTERGEEIVI
jgi:hypothetical protein